MRKLLIALFCLLSVPALAQSVRQSGKVTPGHPVMRTINRTIQGAIDPRSYGVACDGVTNDSPAWATLIDAVPNYSIIMMPAGCTTALANNPGINLSGKSGIHFMGPMAMTEMTPNRGAWFKYIGATDGVVIHCAPCANIYFEGIGIDLNNTAAKGFEAVYDNAFTMQNVIFTHDIIHSASGGGPGRPNFIGVDWCTTGTGANCESLVVTQSQIYCSGESQNGIGVAVGHSNAVNNEISNNFISFCGQAGVKFLGQTRLSNNVMNGNTIDFNCAAAEPSEIANNRSENFVYFFSGGCPAFIHDNKIGSTTASTIPPCRINLLQDLTLFENNQFFNLDTVPAFCGNVGRLISIGNTYAPPTFDGNGHFTNMYSNGLSYTSLYDTNYGPGGGLPVQSIGTAASMHVEDVRPALDGVKTALIAEVSGAYSTSAGSAAVKGIIDGTTSGAAVKGTSDSAAGGTSVAMIEADLSHLRNPVAGYGLLVDPASGTVGANTIYGVYIGKVNGSVSFPWGVYQADIGDPNLFAGPVINKPTTVALLPACTSSLDGARMWVTDQNTAVSYRGAVTGGGSTHQAVVCNGATTSWIQD